MGGYRLMGIVNVTPDSFSDGGLFFDADAAVRHGLGLVDEGAHILDVGGESTRPGAEPVDPDEELRRVVPVIERLATGTREMPARSQISIDTSKATVARAALSAGASFVNDVTALRGDRRMVEVVGESGAECCLMHMLGEPRTMQLEPRYGDVVDEVRSFLEERLAFAVGQGVAEQRIVLDPGIGFGKTVAHNLQLLRRLDELAAIGRPVLVGTSRKSFLGKLTAHARGDGAPDTAAVCDTRAGGASHVAGRRAGGRAQERLPETIATNVLALQRGATLFRVHDVAPMAAALAVAAATLSGTWTATSPASQTSPTS